MINKYLSDIDRIKKYFKNIIIDTLVMNINDRIISWPNYSSGVLKKLYSKEYESLKNERQYSFLLANNSFVQLFYEFDVNGKLNKAKLAYYPYPVKLREKPDDIENYYSITEDTTIGEYYYDLWSLFQSEMGKNASDSDVTEISNVLERLGVSEHEILEDKFNKKYLLTNTSHIRIDYDSKVLSHHKFEIQYGGLSSIRLPLKQIISPFLFMDLIVRYEFPDFYQILSNKMDYIASYKAVLKNSIEISGFKENNIYMVHD